MPGVNVMANNDNAGNVAAQRQPLRDPSPELQRHRGGGCWSKFWCLGYSRKRGIRIVPARQDGSNGSASAAWGSGAASSSTAANQFVGISPSLLAPPSSPASFANSGNPSTAQSPAAFTVSLCLPTATACSPAFDSTATMFTIGPYAHETTLVTPPAFSAFTTAPSTAPFTPPPELAHFTTPSSPDVPFAQLLTSLKNRSSVNHGKMNSNVKSPYSASPFASPDYVSRSGDCIMQSGYQMYPESPLTSLISPASGISESGPPSPLPELDFPAAITAAAKSSRTVRMTSFSSEARLRRGGGGASTTASGHETPRSVDSNNHSRELEPIKILSPPREYWSSRIEEDHTNAAAAAAAALEVEDDDQPSEEAEGGRAESCCFRGESDQQDEVATPASSSSCDSQEHQQSPERSSQDGELLLERSGSSGRIVLKVEMVVCDDDQVKVKMRAKKKNGFHHRQRLSCNGFGSDGVVKQWRWEEADTMSVDWMELNLSDNTIRAAEEDDQLLLKIGAAAEEDDQLLMKIKAQAEEDDQLLMKIRAAEEDDQLLLKV